MLRAGKQVRFTRSEADEFRRMGVDLTDVRTQADLEAVFAFWANTLAEERPELLEKIARRLAEAKGVKLPPRLTSVAPSPDSSGQLQSSDQQSCQDS